MGYIYGSMTCLLQPFNCIMNVENMYIIILFYFIIIIIITSILQASSERRCVLHI